LDGYPSYNDIMAKNIKVLSVNVSSGHDMPEKPATQFQPCSNKMSGKEFVYPQNYVLRLMGKERNDRISEIPQGDIMSGTVDFDIITEGYDLTQAMPLDRFSGENMEIEVIKVLGKSPYAKGVTHKETGKKSIPAEGIYARVTTPGILKPGDILEYIPRIFYIEVVTLSDRAYRGEYKDLSGPRVEELINIHFSKFTRTIKLQRTIIPDDENLLKQLIGASTHKSTDILITTGGTGVGMRDITVDTIKPMLTNEVPGIMEMIRVKYGSQKPQALLSRSVVGFIDNMLVYTLPGSVKAVNEYMEEILKTVDHLIYMRHGLDVH
jgi:molybdopterin adenylyltransferase